MKEYTLITFDRYDVEGSVVSKIKSNLPPKKAFVKFLIDNEIIEVEDDPDIHENIKSGKGFVGFDSEEVSWIMLK
jgi:hypothetical protein